MSNENEQNSDELDFDMNAVRSEDGHSFTDDDFNPFADHAFSAAPTMGDGESVPFAEPTERKESEELPAGATDAGDFDFSAYTEEAAETPPSDENVPFGDSPDILDDLPAPSPFLVGEDEPAEEAAVPTVETDGKKSKKKKDKKEKKPKIEKKPKAEKKKKAEKEPKEKGESLELGAIFSLVLAGLLLVGLIAVNVWTVLSPPASVGFTSTIYYLVGIDLFGLCGILAPVLFYVYRADIDVFKVSLGLSVMALCLGTIFLMTPLYHYDFDFKGSSTLPSRPAPAAPAAPAPEAPAEETPAAETPTEDGAADAADIFGE